jgi:hypothetical protein
VPKSLIGIPIICFIGFVLSAAYLVPFLYEKNLLNLMGFGDGLIFSDFFVLPNLTDKVPSGHFWPVLYEQYLLYIIIFSFCLIFLFLRVLRLKHAHPSQDAFAINMFFIGTVAGSMFLLFGISQYIWEIMPFFTYIQYPVRWLIITYFSLMFLSAAGFDSLHMQFAGRRGVQYVSITIVFLICIFFDYGYISKAHIFTKKELMPFKGVNFAPEHLPAWVILDKIKKDKDFGQRATLLAGEGEVNISRWKSAERSLEITAHDPLIVRVRTFNFPGWKAYVDKTPTYIETEKDTGAMLIEISQGKHELVLRFEDTAIRYYSKIISLVSIIIVAVLILFSQKTVTGKLPG